MARTFACLRIAGPIIGSDYPHPPSTFPTAAAGIEDMQGLSEEDKANIRGGNMMRVLGLSELEEDL